MRKELGFAPFLIIFVILILGIIGYFAYKDFSKNSAAQYPIVPGLGYSTPQATPYMSVPTPETLPKISWQGLPQIMKDISNQKYITWDNKEIKFSDPYKGWYWWVSDNGYNIFGNSDEISLFVPVSINDTSFEPDVLNFIKTINQLFVEDGWKLNSANTSKSVTSGEFYDYIQAYAKDNWKCIIVTDGDISGNNKDGIIRDIRVSCFDDSEYNKDYQIQEPILADLNDKDSIIQIDKQIENFIIMGIRGRRAGAIEIIKKVSGHWQKVLITQDQLFCSLNAQYGLPQGLIEDCATPYPSTSQ